MTSLTERRIVNSLTSMFKRKPAMIDENQPELPLEPSPQVPAQEPAPQTSPETADAEVPGMVVTRLAIFGQGTDRTELHIGDGCAIKIIPLTNPVTAKQIADILATLG